MSRLRPPRDGSIIEAKIVNKGRGSTVIERLYVENKQGMAVADDDPPQESELRELNWSGPGLPASLGPELSVTFDLGPGGVLWLMSRSGAGLRVETDALDQLIRVAVSLGNGRVSKSNWFKYAD